MNYFSVCDGIGAAHAALLPLGYRCVGVSEIDKYCNQLIEEKYEGKIKNYGDFNEWRRSANEWKRKELGEAIHSANLIIGGTPCQPFSIIGKRDGTKDPRSDVTFNFICATCWHFPQWFVWENVPGILSIDGGGYFRRMLAQFTKCGYGVAWRVLDAQFFGVPQRRRRVYVVGCFGDPVRAGRVLFDTETVPLLTKKLPKAKHNNSRAAAKYFGSNRRVSGTVMSNYSSGVNSDRVNMIVIDKSGTILARQGRGVCKQTINTLAITNGRARRLTPLECERLQGFPDGYTAGFSNHQRYKMLGNSMPVPVIRWIGERILREEGGDEI